MLLVVGCFDRIIKYICIYIIEYDCRKFVVESFNWLVIDVKYEYVNGCCIYKYGLGMLICIWYFWEVWFRFNL